MTRETMKVLKRGLTKHCPHCGKGKLFENWNTFQRACPYCGCEFVSGSSSRRFADRSAYARMLAHDLDKAGVHVVSRAAAVTRQLERNVD